MTDEHIRRFPPITDCSDVYFGLASADVGELVDVLRGAVNRLVMRGEPNDHPALVHYRAVLAKHERASK